MHSGENPIMGMTRRLLNQPARYLYTREYSDHETDANRTLEQSVDALSFALNSPLLPPHQYTTASEYVFNAVKEHQDQQPNVDIITPFTDHSVRRFSWEIGTPIPLDAHRLPDRNKILQMVQNNQTIQSVNVYSTYDPRRKSILNFRFYNRYLSRNVVDVTSYLGILLKKQSTGGVILDEEMPYLCKTVEISGTYTRHTFSNDMKTLSVLGTDGWTSLYYVGDCMSHALYFCTINPLNAGKKSPKQQEHEVLEHIPGIPQTL